MDEQKLKNNIEAVLFACGTPVETAKIAQALEISNASVDEICKQLAAEYEQRGGGIRIVKLGESYQMCSVEEYAETIRTVLDLRKNTPLSQAALEVLAIIAYNQPVTKSFIEQIRGVDCSGVVSSLVSRALVEEKGRLELPGRPLLYGTTENFLRCFNISSPEELPPLPQKNDEASSTGEETDNSSKANENNAPQGDEVQ